MKTKTNIQGPPLAIVTPEGTRIKAKYPNETTTILQAHNEAGQRELPARGETLQWRILDENDDTLLATVTLDSDGTIETRPT